MREGTAAAMASQLAKKAQRTGLSYNAKKGIVTGVLIVALVVVILVIYYPSLFPRNW